MPLDLCICRKVDLMEELEFQKNMLLKEYINS